MKIKSLFKSLASRVENAFGKSERLDLDLIEQLDRSWSGKARHGPIHYKPGSREASRRSPFPCESFLPSDSLPMARASPPRGVVPVSSEPCSISNVTNASAVRGPERDSASSVHEPEPQMFSAPMDIYPSAYLPGPNGPLPMRQNNRVPTWQRRRQQAAGAAARRAAAVEAKERNDAGRREDGSVGKSTLLARKSCLKQGGLSTALSREPSVHRGVKGIPSHDDPFRRGSIEAVESSAAIGSWGERKVTFGRTDSAHTDDDGQPPAKLTPPSDGVDPDALAAALTALGEDLADVDTLSSSGSPGIVVGDTDLAIEWPESEEAGPLRLAAEATSGSTVYGPRSAVSDQVLSCVPVTNLRRAHSLGAAEDELVAEALAAVGDGNPEWNTRFLKRWRAVKQRARLQALGMRSIWKLSSPGRGVHHPPELLTNEMPESRAVQVSTSGGHVHDLELSSPSLVRSGENRINRDPSLATMLLGEVAEVC